MNMKVLLRIGIVALLQVLLFGITRYMEIRNRQTDPNWQIANEVYKLETALKEVDEDYECQSVSKVTPFTCVRRPGGAGIPQAMVH